MILKPKSRVYKVFKKLKAEGKVTTLSKETSYKIEYHRIEEKEKIINQSRINQKQAWRDINKLEFTTAQV